ncbi:MAG TPA: potassium transporter TrkG, partial [Elusimicrobiales bacterium]|nr:potassium transporter TrkG [Elusimicrobiales bacterium]
GANLLLIAAGAALFFLFENNGTLRELSASAKLYASVFMPVTARTTGFQLFDLGGMGTLSTLLILTLMFIGGAPASAAGGIKVTAAAALWTQATALLRGSCEPKLCGEKLGPSLLAKAAAVALLLCGVSVAASLLLWLLEPQPYMKVLFEAVSAINTVGLSMGITPSLSPASKAILIICMFLGRIGPILIVISHNTRSPHKDEPVLLG